METAVEWLADEIHKNIDWIPIPMQEQALEMEKEQIEMAYKADLDFCSDEDAEEYYNKTFNQQ
jgi:hypothetical protein